MIYECIPGMFLICRILPWVLNWTLMQNSLRQRRRWKNSRGLSNIRRTDQDLPFCFAHKRWWLQLQVHIMIMINVVAHCIDTNTSNSTEKWELEGSLHTRSFDYYQLSLDYYQLSLDCYQLSLDFYKLSVDCRCIMCQQSVSCRHPQNQSQGLGVTA